MPVKSSLAGGDSYYSVAQASAITDVPSSAINQYLDRDLLDFALAAIGGGFRVVKPDGLLPIRLVHEFVDALSNDGRREAVRKLLAKPTAKSIELEDGKLIVSVAQARAAVAAGLKAYNKAVSMVSSDPAILSGEPCLKGTRQSVYTIAGLLNDNGREALIEAYPDLSNDQIEAARLYALGQPRRGRPRSVGDVITKSKAKLRRTRSMTID